MHYSWVDIKYSADSTHALQRSIRNYTVSIHVNIQKVELSADKFFGNANELRELLKKHFSPSKNQQLRNAAKTKIRKLSRKYLINSKVPRALKAFSLQRNKAKDDF